MVVGCRYGFWMSSGLHPLIIFCDVCELFDDGRPIESDLFSCLLCSLFVSGWTCLLHLIPLVCFGADPNLQWVVNSALIGR